MSKVIKVIFNVALVLMIIILLAYALFRYTNKADIYKVETGSMEDNIHTGDYILVAEQNEYTVDDIVTFEINGYRITHRIIQDNGETVVTKGDANNVEDDEISKKLIVGKVIYRGGFLNFIIKYKYLLISIFLVLYLVTWVYDSKKKKA